MSLLFATVEMLRFVLHGSFTVLRIYSSIVTIQTVGFFIDRKLVICNFFLEHTIIFARETTVTVQRGIVLPPSPLDWCPFEVYFSTEK